MRGVRSLLLQTTSPYRKPPPKSPGAAALPCAPLAPMSEYDAPTPMYALPSLIVAFLFSSFFLLYRYTGTFFRYITSITFFSFLLAESFFFYLGLSFHFAIRSVFTYFFSLYFFFFSPFYYYFFFTFFYYLVATLAWAHPPHCGAARGRPAGRVCARYNTPFPADCVCV